MNWGGEGVQDLVGTNQQQHRVGIGQQHLVSARAISNLAVSIGSAECQVGGHDMCVELLLSVGMRFDVWSYRFAWTEL